MADNFGSSFSPRDVCLIARSRHPAGCQSSSMGHGSLDAPMIVSLYSDSPSCANAGPADKANSTASSWMFM